MKHAVTDANREAVAELARADCRQRACGPHLCPTVRYRTPTRLALLALTLAWCRALVSFLQWEETLRAHSGTYTEAGYSASKRAADCKQLSYATARQHTLWKSASVKTAASLVRGLGLGAGVGWRGEEGNGGWWLSIAAKQASGGFMGGGKACRAGYQGDQGSRRLRTVGSSPLRVRTRNKNVCRLSVR